MYGYDGGLVFRILVPVADCGDVEIILKGSEMNFVSRIYNGFKYITVMCPDDDDEDFLERLCKGYSLDLVSTATIISFVSVICRRS